MTKTIRVVLGATLAAACLAGTPASGAELDPGWKKSFTAAMVGAQPAGPPKPLLVVGAGQQDSAAAVEALRTAYRQVPSSALVMDSSPIGDVSALDDIKIVKAAAKRRLPVERVAVLRVFPGSAAGKETAVVTVYDMAGKTLAAFTVERGKAPSGDASAAGNGSGAGVSGAAAGAVADVLHDQKKPPENKAALKKFYRKAVWFQDWAGINQYGQVVATWSVAMRGIQRERLDGADFYTAVERPDLADKYSKKNNLRIGLAATGGALMAGGIVTMVVATVKALDNVGTGLETAGNVSYQYAKPSTTPLWITSGVLFAGGIGVLIGGLVVNPHPVRPDEARQLAIDYDVKLRKDLGLPPLSDGEEEEADDEEKPKKAKPRDDRPSRDGRDDRTNREERPRRDDRNKRSRQQVEQDDDDADDDDAADEDRDSRKKRAPAKSKKRPNRDDDRDDEEDSMRRVPQPTISNIAIVPAIGPGGGGLSASFQF